MAKKPSNNWKLIDIFSQIWSEQYQGQIYPRSGRDLKASKDFLELYPNLFEDEVEQMAIREWMKNYVADNFWHKPNGTPPMHHEFHFFVNHATKYTTAKKKQTARPHTVVRNSYLDAPAITEEAFQRSFGNWRENLTGDKNG